MSELSYGEFLHRQAGKTHKAVEWAKKYDGVIICFSHQEARRLQKDYGVHAESFRSAYRLNGSNRPFIVDNADLIPLRERAALFRQYNFCGSSWSPR